MNVPGLVARVRRVTSPNDRPDSILERRWNDRRLLPQSADLPLRVVTVTPVLRGTRIAGKAAAHAARRLLRHEGTAYPIPFSRVIALATRGRFELVTVADDEHGELWCEVRNLETGEGLFLTGTLLLTAASEPLTG